MRLRTGTKIFLAAVAAADIFAIVMTIITELYMPSAVISKVIDDTFIKDAIFDRYMEIVAGEFLYLALALTTLLTFLLFNEFGKLMPFVVRFLIYFVFIAASVVISAIIISETIRMNEGEYEIIRESCSGYMISQKNGRDTYHISYNGTTFFFECDKALYDKVKSAESPLDIGIYVIRYHDSVIGVYDCDTYKLSGTVSFKTD